MIADTDVLECMQHFMKKAIGNLPPDVMAAANVQGNHFRDRRLYNHRVDEILKANVQALRFIFQKFKDPQHRRGTAASVKTMDIKEWINFFSTFQLAELGLSQREAQFIFIHSVPLVVDELVNEEKAQYLHFVHFLEAFCRVADAIDIPDAEVRGVVLEMEVFL